VNLIKSEFGKSTAHASRCKIYSTQGKLSEAIKEFDEAIRLAPTFAYHYDNRGETFALQGNFERAITDYSEAIRLEPKNQFFYSDRAKAYRQLGNADQAELDEVSANAMVNGNPPAPK
jgi:tetratricopeptide (TPR) repeat protein